MNKLPAPSLPEWISAMLPDTIERYVVSIDSMRMHVMEAGQGRPVLLVHGNPTWSFLYRKVVQALSGEPLRLIIPDLIGLGLSDKPGDLGAHTIVNHSGWLGQFIDQLDLDGLIFVGQDWGGPIGLHALSSRTERVAGMVILNTAVGPPKPGFRPSFFHRLSRLPVLSHALFRVIGFPQNNLGAAQGDKSSISGQVSRAYRYPLRKLRERAGCRSALGYS
ncbi:MAG: alpha/beta fold hydrolase [Myxococcota bacterium]